MWKLATTHEPVMWRPDHALPGHELAFSTRRGGLSDAPFESLNLGLSTADEPAAVAGNRVRVLRGLRLDPERLATAGQVHGSRVAVVSVPGHERECDGLVTTVAGLALAVTTADCMALLLAAPRAVGAAHAGWRGVAGGMPVAALETVVRASGCVAADVEVHFGPCIRGCCYEVGEDVAARFPAAAVRLTGGRPRLDLPTAARLALIAAGVPPAGIADTGACTSCEPHWYFSHRRDHGRTGRMWGIAALREQS